MTKNQAVRVDFEDESDDYDIAEANCELAMVEGQLCSILYELYDLPDLTGILSTETWNSFLTEEERFFLSCFLPDMDQETFNLTMQELVSGADLYFGNPVNEFYKRLRGGLFTPKVACYRDGSTLFKRKKYYYSLKFYHEKIIKTFTEMQRLWDQYGKKLGNKERLILWSEQTKSRNLKLLDLNRVPSGKMDGVATYSFTTPKEVKSVERIRMKSSTFPFGGSSKNTLKIKITKKGAFQYQGSSLLVSPEHPPQTLPKGLLKVAPKYSSTILREPYVAAENNLRQVHEAGSISRYPASPYSDTKFWKPFGNLPKCLLNQQETCFTDLEASQSSKYGKEPVLHDPTHTLPTKQEEYVHYHLNSASSKPGIVVRGSETEETKRILSGKHFQSEDNVLRKPLRVLSKDNLHARETDDDHLISLTYKRRKIQRIGVS